MIKGLKGLLVIASWTDPNKVKYSQRIFGCIKSHNEGLFAVKSK